MKTNRKTTMPLLAASILLIGCSSRTHNQSKSTPLTKTAQTPWLLGADISALAGGRTPRTGTTTYQDNNLPGTEISIMKAHGWNAFRLRVFVSPVRSAPNNSLENTIALAKQIKAAGATFLLDIHYSDTWADPQHQETPIPWRTLDAAALATQVETYTKDVLTQLQAAGAPPDMVQVGNETTGGMLWPLGHVQVPHSDIKTDAGRIQPLPTPYDDATQWANLIRFIKAGTKGVREATADHPVKIVIHIDCGGDWPITKWYFDHLTQSHVDYDIIGQSFYPNYHGTLSELQNNMANCERAYHKPFLVAETGYPQTGGDRITTRKYMFWPGTQQGQLQFLTDLVNTVKQSPNALGVFYWAPESHGTGNGLWNSDGSPAPSLSLLDHLSTLTTRPASHLPPDPADSPSHLPATMPAPIPAIPPTIAPRPTTRSAPPTTAPVAEIIPWPENPSISPDYIVGADLSWVPQREASGTQYSDNGTQKDILEILKSHGFNYIRLRLFVDPTKPTPRDRPYSPAGFCDLPHTITMAKRIKAAGMKFLLDFHYSDSWADPGKQFTPSSWKNLSFPDLVTQLHDYTKDAVQQLKDAGATPDMVQVGNEITPGLLTDAPNGGGSTKNWNQLSQLLSAGLTAVKQVDPKILTMLHIDKGGNNPAARTWVDNALSHGLHFDVLGLSCYQRWQGPPSTWKANFTDLASRYPHLKFVMAEVDAQAQNANAIMTSLPHQQGLGTFIWEPTANNANQALFNNRGEVIPSKMSAYDEVTKKLNLKQ